MATGTKITIGVCASVLLVFLFSYCSFKDTYNQMVRLSEDVSAQWAQVQNVYQRRMDLIPNLAATVQAAAAHEASVFTQVAEARSKAGGVISISSDMIDDPDTFARFQQAQGELTGALQRLISVTENYPELRANENFLALQDQLEGAENRISVERKRFNDAAAQYNTYIKEFPRILIANMTGFKEKPYFSADEGASSAPVLSFSGAGS